MLNCYIPLREALGLTKDATDEQQYRDLIMDLKSLAECYLDLDVGLRHQDHNKWKRFAHKACTRFPVFRKYEGGWPLRVYGYTHLGNGKHQPQVNKEPGIKENISPEERGEFDTPGARHHMPDSDDILLRESLSVLSSAEVQQKQSDLPLALRRGRRFRPGHMSAVAARKTTMTSTSHIRASVTSAPLAASTSVSQLRVPVKPLGSFRPAPVATPQRSATIAPGGPKASTLSNAHTIPLSPYESELTPVSDPIRPVKSTTASTPLLDPHSTFPRRTLIDSEPDSTLVTEPSGSQSVREFLDSLQPYLDDRNIYSVFHEYGIRTMSNLQGLAAWSVERRNEVLAVLVQEGKITRFEYDVLRFAFADKKII